MALIPDAPDFFDEWEASALLEGFMKLMMAAAVREDEEVVRLVLAQAFTHDRPMRDVTIPHTRTWSTSFGEHITWAILHMDPEDQERIYLEP